MPKGKRPDSLQSRSNHSGSGWDYEERRLHRTWCEANGSYHAKESCPFWKDRSNYFRAPCCDRYVRFLVKPRRCSKCIKCSPRGCCRRERSESDCSDTEYVAQVYDAQIGLKHKLDTEQLDDILSKLDVMADTKIDRLVDGVKSTLAASLGTFTAVAAPMIGDFVAKLFVALAAVIRARSDPMLVILCISQFLLSVGIIPAAVEAFRNFVGSGSGIGYEAQAGILPVDKIFNIIGFVISLLMLGSAPNIKGLTDFFRSISSIRNFSDIGSSIVSTIQWCVAHAINYVKVTFLGYEDTLIDEVDPIIEWCCEVDDFECDFNKTGLWTDEFIERHERIYSGMLEHVRFVNSRKSPATLLSLFNPHCNVVRKRAEELTIAGVRQMPRIEPTFVMIVGASSIGKSLITPVICVDLINEFFSEKAVDERSWTKYVYNRVVEQDFWDGYHNHKIINYDDFGQAYDSVNEPNPEFMEIIRLGNSAPYFPHMARLEDKGRTRITAEFVIMTANREITPASVQSLKEPEAVRRRINILIKADVIPEVKENGVVDIDKINAYHKSRKCGCTHNSSVCLGIYRFDVCPYKGGQHIPFFCAQTYAQTVDIIKSFHKKTRTIAQDRLSFLNDRINNTSVRDATITFPTVDGKLCTAKYNVLPDSEDSEVFVMPCETVREKATDDLIAKGNGPKNKKGRKFEYVAQAGSNFSCMKCRADKEVRRMIRNYAYDLLEVFNNHGNGCDCYEFIYALHNCIGLADGPFPDEIHHILSWHFSCSSTHDYFPEECWQYVNAYREVVRGFVEEPPHNCVAYFAQGGDQYDDIVKDVLVGHKHAIDTLEFWWSNLPTTSHSDRAPSITPFVQERSWDASLLRMYAEQEAIPINYERKNRVSLYKNMLKTGLKEKLDKLSKLSPAAGFIMLAGAGVVTAALVALFRFAFKPADADNDTEMGDIVRVRMVGSQFKKTFSNNDAVKVDENDEALYVRVDKKKYVAESSTTSGDSGSSRRSNSRSIEYSRWRKNPDGSYKTYTAHAYDDPNLLDVERTVLKNMYFAYKRVEGALVPLGNIVAVRGRVFLAFHHMLSCVDDDTEIVLTKCINKDQFSVYKREIICVQLTNGRDKIDAALLQFPRRFPQARDIISHFVHESDVNHECFNGRMMSAMQVGDANLVRISGGLVKSCDEPVAYHLRVKGQLQELFIRRFYEYTWDTKGGDCGAILLQSETSSSRKILGIHVAGDTLRASGLSVPIFADMIEEAMKSFSDKEAQIFTVYEALKGEDIDESVADDILPFQVIGAVSDGLTDMTTSSIVPSPLYDKLARHTTRPAVLFGSIDEGNGPVEFKVRALNKNKHMNVLVDQIALTVAKKEIYNLLAFRSKYDCLKKRPLTIEEATFGATDFEYIPSINVQSSAGYPWMKGINKRGKGDYVNLESNFISDEVREAVSRRISKAMEGEQCLTIFSDHLKDERRPIEDYKFLKPRVIAGAPIDYSIAFRMYFGAFMGHVMENRINNSIAVGVNPHGDEWTIIANKLLTKGHACTIACDFSNYDGTLNADFLWAVLDVINSWYDDGNSRIRSVLWVDIVNSIHLFRNTVYQLDHSNPSGNPATTILNSVYHLILIYYVLIKLGISVFEIKKRVYAIVYGDDNLISFANRFVPMDAFVKEIQNIGMKVTCATKDGLPEYTTLDKLTFLKRSFSFDVATCKYHGRLPESVILEMPMWYKKPNSWEEVGLAIMDASVREYAHYDEGTFNGYVEHLRKVCRENYVEVCPIDTFAFYRAQMNNERYIAYEC